ncbi:MAG: hypothetical protein WBL93_04995 [Lutisporaceae bacterium]
MYKLLKALIIILLLTFPLSLNVKAEDVMNINDLIEKAKELDRQEVTIQGEVIGERMDRVDFSWININDGTNAIGIWINKSEAVKISHYGNYKYKGDIVKITGTFHRACAEHGGEADLHNKSITIVEDGHPVKEQISSAKIICAAVFTSLALLMYVIFIKVVIKKTIT